LPKWDGGYIFYWNHDTAESARENNLFVYDAKGASVLSTRLWFTGAGSVRIISVASSHGVIAAVGMAVEKTGFYTGYLAIVEIASAKATIVRTGVFEGKTVAFGPDGNIWLLGYELGEGRRIETAKPHGALRRYRPDGASVGEQLLMWPEIKCGLHPGDSSKTGTPVLAPSGDRVGVLLASCNRWVEFGRDGRQLGSWQFDEVPDKAGVWTVAIVDGFVYASIGQRLYQLLKETGTWRPVDMTAASQTAGPLNWLAGVDSGQFVYSVAHGDFIWTKLARLP